MSTDPKACLEAALAAGLAPDGVAPPDLRRALDAWNAWRHDEGRDPTWLSVEAGASYLEALCAAAPERSAQARFATFQMAAGLAWGPETAAHLARTLRDHRVAAKGPRGDRWSRAETAVARLPTPWREAFLALLERSRDRPASRLELVWSADRIGAVAAALTRFAAYAEETGADPVPTARLFQGWAESLRPTAAAISVASYLARVVDGFERVLTPGLRYDAAAAIADGWAARAGDAPTRKGKGARVVPASDLDALGFAMMAEAEAAPIRRIGEAMLYRDGLSLAVVATLPERARGVAALAFDQTLHLEADGVIRFAIPGDALKRVERRKARAAFHARIRRPALYGALARWRTIWRPLFDDGDWLWPSRLDQARGLSEKTLGKICGDVTEARLGIRVSLHGVRDCVATEIVETDPTGGPLRAKGVLGHRDQRTTDDFYVHANGIAIATEWRPIVEAIVGPSREDLSF